MLYFNDAFNFRDFPNSMWFRHLLSEIKTSLRYKPKAKFKILQSNFHMTAQLPPKLTTIINLRELFIASQLQRNCNMSYSLKLKFY